MSIDPPRPGQHDHMRCRALANDFVSVNTVDGAMKNQKKDGQSGIISTLASESNILLYVRKTSDLADVMHAMTVCIEHIFATSGKKGYGRVTNICMEGWAFKLLRENTPLYDAGQVVGVNMKEWLPAFVPSDELNVSERGSSNSQIIEPKTQQNFSFVYCIGGDGTLLRLLRVLFFKTLPPQLPKIVTFSMGSLNYLC